MPCTASLAFSRSTISMSSDWVVVAGSRIVSPAMPSSREVASLLRTYTALAGSSPTSTTLKPGVIPCALRRSTSARTSLCTRSAIAVPSMMFPRTGDSVFSATSSRKVDCPRLANEHHLDLSRVLKLRLDSARDLFGHGRHADVVHVIGHDDDAHFASRLNRVDLFDSLVAGRDALEPFESLHICLECFASRAWTRSRDRVGRLHQYRHLALVRHVVVVRRNAVHDERILTVLGRDLDAELHVGALVLVREHLADVVQERAALGEVDVEP